MQDSTKGMLLMGAIVAAFGGIVVTALIVNPKYETYPETLERQEKELERLEGALRSANVRAAALKALADSLGQAARRSADTVRIEVHRYRDVATRLRRQLDSLQAHVPDSAAATSWLDLGDVRVVLERGDSLAQACTRLTRDCDRALAAADSALAARDSTLAVQRQRTLRLEDYRAELAARLRAETRKKWFYGLGGVGLTLAVCSVAN